MMQRMFNSSTRRSDNRPIWCRRWAMASGIGVVLLGSLLLLLFQSFPDSLMRMRAWSAPLQGKGPDTSVEVAAARSPASEKGAPEADAAEDSPAVATRAATPRSKSARGSKSARDSGSTLRERLIGRWKQHRAGWRYLTIRSDGTATMTVQPEGMWKLLLGSRLQFEIEWSLEDGYLAYAATGGRPHDKVELVRQMWGEGRRQKIETLTDERLVLLDETGNPENEWTRMTKDVPGGQKQHN